MQSQLQINNVSKHFGGIVAVQNVNFSVPSQGIVSVIGPNGAGKTTLFNLITGFYSPDSGSIQFEGVELNRLPPHGITRAGVARTFQNIRLFPWMTVRDNIIVARQVKCDGGIFRVCLRSPLVRRQEQATLDKVEEILSFFKLQDKSNLQAKNLPYGDQRKLEMARALATEPKLVLLDEPTAGMNSAESEECVETIFNINEEFSITVLLIEHNMNVVMGISDRVIVLDYGSKIAEGSPASIQRNEEVIKAYLGEDYFGNA